MNKMGEILAQKKAMRQTENVVSDEIACLLSSYFGETVREYTLYVVTDENSLNMDYYDASVDDEV